MLTRQEIESWLRETDRDRLRTLWRRADAARRSHVGDAVHLRGLIEFSNHCDRMCAYCGLRAGNREIRRYRLAAAEILQCAEQAVQLGYGTVVLQSGEDPGVDAGWMAEVIRTIKEQTSLAVTLSLGERSADELRQWRAAGADRYLLRFESSNPVLYRRIHPPRRRRDVGRLALLDELRRLGYEVGSGTMVGLPGQSWEDLTNDLELMRRLELDMIGVGPYLPHPATPLGRDPDRWRLSPADQVPADAITTLKTIALARLLCPWANIPATTALATLDPVRGRERGLEAGANVIMPSVTPLNYRVDYEIYPNKACLRDGASACGRCVRARIEALGRTVGIGRGDSLAYHQHAAVAVLSTGAASCPPSCR